MSLFSRVETPPTESDIAVWGPIEAYPEYEFAVHEARVAWEGIVEVRLRSGNEWERIEAINVLHGLALPRGENGPVFSRLGAQARAIGALGAARFEQLWCDRGEEVGTDLAFDPEGVISTHHRIMTHSIYDRDVRDLLDIPSKDMTDEECQRDYDLEDLSYIAARPLAGISEESLQSGLSGVVPCHPTLQFWSTPDTKGPQRHDGWYRGDKLWVQRVTRMPQSGAVGTQERVLVIPYADTSKEY